MQIVIQHQRVGSQPNNRYTGIKIADQHAPGPILGSQMHYGNRYARMGRSPVLLRSVAICRIVACWPRLKTDEFSGGP